MPIDPTLFSLILNDPNQAAASLPGPAPGMNATQLDEVLGTSLPLAGSQLALQTLGRLQQPSGPVPTTPVPSLEQLRLQLFLQAMLQTPFAKGQTVSPGAQLIQTMAPMLMAQTQAPMLQAQLLAEQAKEKEKADLARIGALVQQSTLLKNLSDLQPKAGKERKLMRVDLPGQGQVALVDPVTGATVRTMENPQGPKAPAFIKVADEQGNLNWYKPEDFAVAGRKAKPIATFGPKERDLPAATASDLGNRRAAIVHAEKLITQFDRAFPAVKQDQPVAFSDAVRLALAANNTAANFRDMTRIDEAGTTREERLFIARYNTTLMSLRSYTTEVGVISETDAERIMRGLGNPATMTPRRLRTQLVETYNTLVRNQRIHEQALRESSFKFKPKSYVRIPQAGESEEPPRSRVPDMKGADDTRRPAPAEGGGGPRFIFRGGQWTEQPAPGP